MNALQVRKLLSSYRAIIVGKRFPIVIVNVGNSQLEVSSFSTNAEDQAFPLDVNAMFNISRQVSYLILISYLFPQPVSHKE